MPAIAMTMDETELPIECRISVIVPVYNTGALLNGLLTSLLEQRGVSLEVIAVDDGSTDESLATLQEFSRRDARLKVLSRAHAGPSAARNAGLQQARGKWIAFADSDDWLNPAALKIWSDHAEQNQLDLLIGNGFNFTSDSLKDDSIPLLKSQPWKKILAGAEWMVHCDAADEWCHWVWLQLIRRDFLIESGLRFNNGILHEDILWTTSIALAAQRVGFVEQPLYGYRVHHRSATNGTISDTLCLRAESYLQLIPYLDAKSQLGSQPPLVSQALSRQAFREGAHLIALIRRRLHDVSTKTALAKRTLDARVPMIMAKGAKTPHEYWRALRGWLLLHKYVAIGAWQRWWNKGRNLVWAASGE